jgi:hypothetical protein
MVKLRKLLTVTEEILSDGGRAAKRPVRKVAAVAVPLHFNDAPRANEIVLAIVVTDGGRPHPRIGGLTKDEARKEDGQR